MARRAPPDDLFARVGLPRRFWLDPTELEARVRRLIAKGGDPQPLHTALTVLTDPVSRAEHLLDLMGGAYQADHTTLPAGFRELLSILHSQLAEARGETGVCARFEHSLAEHRRGHVQRLDFLFRMLADGDNPIVQRDRKRAVRAEVNAIRLLDELVGLCAASHVRL
jgi:hypothetical protein